MFGEFLKTFESLFAQNPEGVGLFPIIQSRPENVRLSNEFIDEAIAQMELQFPAREERIGTISASANGILDPSIISYERDHELSQAEIDIRFRELIAGNQLEIGIKDAEVQTDALDEMLADTRAEENALSRAQAAVEAARLPKKMPTKLGAQYEVLDSDPKRSKSSEISPEEKALLERVEAIHADRMQENPTQQLADLKDDQFAVA